MADADVHVSDDAVVDVELDGVEDAVTEGAGGAAGTTGAVEGATEGGVVTAKPGAADEAANALLEAQRKVEEAQRKVEEEQRRRAAAESQASAERQRADRATQLAQTSEREAAAAREAQANAALTAVTSGIENATRALTAAKAAMKQAHESGDVDKMVEAQEAIGHATAELRDFKNRKADLEGAPKRAATVEPERTEPATTTSTPFERYITGSNFAPQAQEWLRAHPRCVPAWAGGDPTLNNRMMSAHYDAMDRGMQANSPEYFQHLESRIDGAKEGSVTTPPAKGNGVTSVPATPAKKPVASAAPTNEPLAAAGHEQRSQSVRLNAAQQETALFSFPAKPGEDEDAHRRRAFKTYAQEYIKAKAEGKIGRMTH
jgi:hypothetical protein